jgi:hypothetical protein
MIIPTIKNPQAKIELKPNANTVAKLITLTAIILIGKAYLIIITQTIILRIRKARSMDPKAHSVTKNAPIVFESVIIGAT